MSSSVCCVEGSDKRENNNVFITYPVLLDLRQVLHDRLVPNDPREIVERQRNEQVHVYGYPGAPQGPAKQMRRNDDDDDVSVTVAHPR